MPIPQLNLRQVHLDFHTPPEIPDLLQDFNAEDFAATLERAAVNSITCFSRCHHGMIYYRSRRFPERVHPYMQNDLLKSVSLARAGVDVDFAQTNGTVEFVVPRLEGYEICAVELAQR